MALISSYAQKKKLDYFFSMIDKKAKILEVGSADGWVGKYATKNGWKNFTGLDIVEPKETKQEYTFIKADINEWQKTKLKRSSYDVIIAFEVVEHGDFFQSFNQLLKPGGLLIITTPVPHMDPVCNFLEMIGLNQRRTSEHSHLIYAKDIPFFEPVEIKVKGFISQWGVLKKTTEVT